MLGYEIDDEDDSAVYRQWGYYKVLHRGDGFTVKELTILPGKSLSDQRHFKRSEQWTLVKGKLRVTLQKDGKTSETYSLYAKEGLPHSLHISKNTWHRPYNNGTEEVKVIETWIGDSTEEDIERRNVRT